VRHCDVVVIGGGLAGLIAANRLVGFGADVRILEGSSVVGGRAAGRTRHRGRICWTSAHRIAHADHVAGTEYRSAGLSRAPILWRLPDTRRVSRLPPGPVRDRLRLITAWGDCGAKA
jgi:phytoene dehydrogenase-like protein